MSEDKKNNNERNSDYTGEKSDSVLKRTLITLLSNNDYRSDIIITIILFVTMYLYYITDMTDMVFDNIMRTGMALVALEYIGEKIINKFL